MAGSYLLVALVVLAWASAFVGVRALAGELSPGAIACGRYLVAALALLAVAAWARPPLPRWSELPRLLLMGLVGIGAYNLAFNAGLRTVPAGTTSFVVNGLIVLGTAVGGAWWFREQVPRRRWFALAAALLGLLAIALGRDGSLGGPGIPWLVLAALLGIAYNILQKGLLPRFGAIGCTCWAVWTGCLPLAWWLPELWRALPEARPAVPAALLYLGLVPGALGYLLWAAVLARMPASTAGLCLAAIPATVVLLAWAVLGELPAGLSLAGGAVILAAVVWGQWPAQGARSPASTPGAQPNTAR
jgi:drug/metabolite transporter (DMT)-like permease